MWERWKSSPIVLFGRYLGETLVNMAEMFAPNAMAGHIYDDALSRRSAVARHLRMSVPEKNVSDKHFYCGECIS
jgi:hypothetical protein